MSLLLDSLSSSLAPNAWWLWSLLTYSVLPAGAAPVAHSRKPSRAGGRRASSSISRIYALTLAPRHCIQQRERNGAGEHRTGANCRQGMIAAAIFQDHGCGYRSLPADLRVSGPAISEISRNMLPLPIQCELKRPPPALGYCDTDLAMQRVFSAAPKVPSTPRPLPPSPSSLLQRSIHLSSTRAPTYTFCAA